MKRSMRKLMCTAVLLAGAAVPALAQASPSLVRPHAVFTDSADRSDPVGGTGASDRLHVDLSYFTTLTRAAGLVPTDPQQHDVMLDGHHIGSDVAIGGVRANRREIEPEPVAAGIG